MKSQKGFGLVPFLLILLLVTAVGFTGYYVYNQQTKKTEKSEVAGDSLTKITTTPSPSTTPKATVAPAATPTPDTQKYLVIKEWGVKVPLSSGIQNATYKIETSNNEYVYIQNPSLTTSCPHSIGTIWRTDKSSYTELVDGTTKQGIKQGNNYFYYYSSVNPADATNKCNKDIQINSSESELSQALAKILAE